MARTMRVELLCEAGRGFTLVLAGVKIASWIGTLIWDSNRSATGASAVRKGVSSMEGGRQAN